ncbi:MAG: hypothetical protein HYW25_01250, partial [Candidatus Aenigmarchaeota archaeon]|nr:hypothetical protein [Candidatus Aenigmarchaeota archaeon]
LIKDEKFIEASQKAEHLLRQGKENPKLAKLQELVQRELERERRIIVFVQYRDMAALLHKILGKAESARPVVFIGQQKKFGRGMSQKEQLDIIRRFKEGEFNILLATSIGEEGLDIEETDTVIFYEPVPSEIRSIQRAGRTARTRPGKVIIMMVRGTADEAYYWSAYHKGRKMQKMLKQMSLK